MTQQHDTTEPDPITEIERIASGGVLLRFEAATRDLRPSERGNTDHRPHGSVYVQEDRSSITIAHYCDGYEGHLRLSRAGAHLLILALERLFAPLAVSENATRDAEDVANATRRQG